MPYVTDNKISKSPIEGGVEISNEKYSELLSAMSSGHKIKVKGDEIVVLSSTKRTVYSTEDGSEKQIAENDDTPDGYTDNKRPDEFYNWNGSEWEVDQEAKDKAEREELDRISVSRFQAKVALYEAGLLEQVQEYMEGPEVPMKVKLAWEEASFQRGSNMANTIGSELGLSASEIDDLFKAAQEVEA